MCPSFAMRPKSGEAVTEKRGEERRGEERKRYKLFESRVEAEGPEEERSASAEAAAAEEEDILSSEREKERLGRMRERRARRGNFGIQKSRATTATSILRHRSAARRRRSFSMHQRATPLQIRLPPLHSENKEGRSRKKEREGGRKEGPFGRLTVCSTSDRPPLLPSVRPTVLLSPLPFGTAMPALPRESSFSDDEISVGKSFSCRHAFH